MGKRTEPTPATGGPWATWRQIAGQWVYLGEYPTLARAIASLLGAAGDTCITRVGPDGVPVPPCRGPVAEPDRLGAQIRERAMKVGW